MSDKIEKINQSIPTRLSIVPFTGGVLMLIYAFFWPHSYGLWLGQIVYAFRMGSGI